MIEVFFSQRFGIVKIVPPEGWSPPPPVLDNSKRFPTKSQAIHELQQGKDYGNGKNYNVSGNFNPKHLKKNKIFNESEFKEMADDFSRKWWTSHFNNKSEDGLIVTSTYHPNPWEISIIEGEYWRIVDLGEPRLEVEYGNDLDVGSFFSGFPIPFQDHMDMVADWAKDPLDFNDPEYLVVHRHAIQHFRVAQRGQLSLLNELQSLRVAQNCCRHALKFTNVLIF